jgi:hypothetical protein
MMLNERRRKVRHAAAFAASRHAARRVWQPAPGRQANFQTHFRDCGLQASTYFRREALYASLRNPHRAQAREFAGENVRISDGRIRANNRGVVFHL